MRGSGTRATEVKMRGRHPGHVLGLNGPLADTEADRESEDVNTIL